jgi:hypothetical protein
MERFSPSEFPFGFSSTSAFQDMEKETFPTFLDALLADLERIRQEERKAWEAIIREALGG